MHRSCMPSDASSPHLHLWPDLCTAILHSLSPGCSDVFQSCGGDCVTHSLLWEVCREERTPGSLEGKVPSRSREKGLGERGSWEHPMGLGLCRDRHWVPLCSLWHLLGNVLSSRVPSRCLGVASCLPGHSSCTHHPCSIFYGFHIGILPKHLCEDQVLSCGTAWVVAMGLQLKLCFKFCGTRCGAGCAWLCVISLSFCLQGQGQREWLLFLLLVFYKLSLGRGPQVNPVSL